MTGDEKERILNKKFKRPLQGPCPEQSTKRVRRENMNLTESLAPVVDMVIDAGVPQQLPLNPVLPLPDDIGPPPGFERISLSQKKVEQSQGSSEEKSNNNNNYAGLGYNSNPKPESRLAVVRGRQGYPNFGNSCYMNSVLQALFHIRTFTIDLISFYKQKKFGKWSMTEPLVGTALRKCWPTDRSIIRDLVKVLSAASVPGKTFSYGHQQDAHEFLSHILDLLKVEDLNNPDRHVEGQGPRLNVVQASGDQRKDLKVSEPIDIVSNKENTSPHNETDRLQKPKVSEPIDIVSKKENTSPHNETDPLQKPKVSEPIDIVSNKENTSPHNETDGLQKPKVSEPIDIVSKKENTSPHDGTDGLQKPDNTRDATEAGVGEDERADSESNNVHEQEMMGAFLGSSKLRRKKRDRHSSGSGDSSYNPRKTRREMSGGEDSVHLSNNSQSDGSGTTGDDKEVAKDDTDHSESKVTPTDHENRNPENKDVTPMSSLDNADNRQRVSRDQEEPTYTDVSSVSSLNMNESVHNIASKDEEKRTCVEAVHNIASKGQEKRTCVEAVSLLAEETMTGKDRCTGSDGSPLSEGIASAAGQPAVGTAAVLTNPTSTNFEFEVVQTCVCVSCRRSEQKTENFTSLIMDIPELEIPSLQNAVDGFFKKEELDYTCGHCKQQTKVEIIKKIQRLPRLLILYVKRYDGTNSKVEKALKLDSFITVHHHCDSEIVQPPPPGHMDLPSPIPVKPPLSSSKRELPMESRLAPSDEKPYDPGEDLSDSDINLDVKHNRTSRPGLRNMTSPRKPRRLSTDSYGSGRIVDVVDKEYGRDTASTSERNARNQKLDYIDKDGNINAPHLSEEDQLSLVIEMTFGFAAVETLTDSLAAVCPMVTEVHLDEVDTGKSDPSSQQVLSGHYSQGAQEHHPRHSSSGTEGTGVTKVVDDLSVPDQERKEGVGCSNPDDLASPAGQKGSAKGKLASEDGGECTVDSGTAKPSGGSRIQDIKTEGECTVDSETAKPSGGSRIQDTKTEGECTVDSGTAKPAGGSRIQDTKAAESEQESSDDDETAEKKGEMTIDIETEANEEEMGVENGGESSGKVMEPAETRGESTIKTAKRGGESDGSHDTGAAKDIDTPDSRVESAKSEGESSNYSDIDATESEGENVVETKRVRIILNKAAKNEGKRAVEDSGKSAVEDGGKSAVEDSGKYAVEDSGKSAVEDSGKSAVEDGGKSAVEDSGKSAVEDSGKYAVEDSGKSAVEDSGKSAVEDGGKSAVEDSGKSAVEDSGKYAVEDSGKSAVEDSGKSAVEDSGKSAVEDSGKSAVEDGGKSAVEDGGTPERKGKKRNFGGSTDGARTGTEGDGEEKSCAAEQKDDSSLLDSVNDGDDDDDDSLALFLSSVEESPTKVKGRIVKGRIADMSEFDVLSEFEQMQLAIKISLMPTALEPTTAGTGDQSPPAPMPTALEPTTAGTGDQSPPAPMPTALEPTTAGKGDQSPPALMPTALEPTTAVTGDQSPPAPMPTALEPTTAGTGDQESPAPRTASSVDQVGQGGSAPAVAGQLPGRGSQQSLGPAATSLVQCVDQKQSELAAASALGEADSKELRGLPQHTAGEADSPKLQGLPQHTAGEADSLKLQGLPQHTAGEADSPKLQGLPQHTAGEADSLKLQGLPQHTAGEADSPKLQGLPQHTAGEADSLKLQGLPQHTAGEADSPKLQGLRQHTAVDVSSPPGEQLPSKSGASAPSADDLGDFDESLPCTQKTVLDDLIPDGIDVPQTPPATVSPLGSPYHNPQMMFASKIVDSLSREPGQDPMKQPHRSERSACSQSDAGWETVDESDHGKSDATVESIDASFLKGGQDFLQNKGKMYRLVSIVNHLGPTGLCGHYTSDVMEVETGRWFNYNDKQVSENTEEWVLQNCNKSGYIFFYMNWDTYLAVKEQSPLPDDQQAWAVKEPAEVSTEDDAAPMVPPSRIKHREDRENESKEKRGWTNLTIDTQLNKWTTGYLARPI